MSNSNRKGKVCSGSAGRGGAGLAQFFLFDFAKLGLSALLFRKEDERPFKSPTRRFLTRQKHHLFITNSAKNETFLMFWSHSRKKVEISLCRKGELFFVSEKVESKIVRIKILEKYCISLRYSLSIIKTNTVHRALCWHELCLHRTLYWRFFDFSIP